MTPSLRHTFFALTSLCISGCGGSVTDSCPLGPEPIMLLRRTDESISRVVVDETGVFFSTHLLEPPGASDAYSIWRMDRSGGPAERLVSGLRVPDFIVDRTSVYWIAYGPLAVMGLPKEGGEPIAITALQGTTDAAIYSYGSRAYMVSNEKGGTLSLDGFDLLFELDVQIALKIPVIDADALYASVYNLASKNVELRRVDLATGQMETLVDSATTTWSGRGPMAVDASHVYWVEETETGTVIRRVPKRGGHVEPVVFRGYDASASLDVWNGALYWVERHSITEGEVYASRQFVQRAFLSAPMGETTTVAEGVLKPTRYSNLIYSPSFDETSLYYAEAVFPGADTAEWRIMKTCL